MANKENKGAAQAAENVSIENIYESLDKATVATDETLPAKAKEELKKESDERTIDELKRRYQKFSYLQEEGMLIMRRDKEKAKVSSMRLTVINRISRFLMGFQVTEEVITIAKHHDDSLFGIEKVDAKANTITITNPKDKKATTYKIGDNVPAVIDRVDCDDMLKKLKEEVNKRFAEVEKVYDTYSKKLRDKYGYYWGDDWYWFR